jgi:quinol monooxygenase YgiN
MIWPPSLKWQVPRVVTPTPSNGRSVALESHKGAVVPESTIRAGDPVVALINVFTVDPVNQQRLVELWQQGTEEVMRHLPGFVSANIHCSVDGTKVVNYAQWESVEAFNATLQDPRATAYFAQLAEIGTPAPVLCELVSVHHV